MNRKLLIGIWGHGVPFHGESLNEGALGGAETMVIQAAQALAQRGHDVKVFCRCPKPGTHGGVDYYDAETSWRDLAPLLQFDVFLVGRDSSMATSKIQSRMIGIWCHDILVDGRKFTSNLWQTDFVWVLSQFQRDQYLRKAPEIAPIVHLTRNGLDRAIFDQILAEPIQRDPHMYVYGSRPERGLDILLRRVWPRLLQDVDQDAMLLIAGYDVTPEMIPDDVKRYYAYLDELIKATPRVERIGYLKHADWIRLLRQAQAVLYPTRFPEISCLNALMAQVCSTPIITTRDFALRETVGDSANLIEGDPRSDAYLEAFLARVKQLAASSYEYRLTQKKGQRHIDSGRYWWDEIAEEWETFFWTRFEERALKQGGRKVIQAFLYESDLLAAKWVLDHHEEVGVDLAECADLAEEVNRHLAEHHTYPDVYADLDVEPDQAVGGTRFSEAARIIMDHFGDQDFSVLDVGCGSGGFLATLIPMGHPGQISPFGLDFSARLIERAKQFLAQRFPTYKWEERLFVGDFLDHPDPRPDALFDCIFAGEFLEHIIEYEAVLDKLQRWVKPGGLLVFTIPSGAWEAMSFRAPLPVRRPGDELRHHIAHYQMRDLQEIFGGQEFWMKFLPAGVSTIDASLLGWWFVKIVVRGRPFGKVDYRRKFLTTRPYQFVSACMIVRNEEDNLSRCLKSLGSVFDELIIVDTGSTDRTIEIAKRYTDKVFELEWPDDFSEARNYSISKADPRADWIYWMDADEVLVNGNRLRKYLGTQLFDGYVIRQNHLIFDVQDAKPDVPIRVFRHGRGYRFYGCLAPGTAVLANPDLLPIEDVKVGTLVATHDGTYHRVSRLWKYEISDDLVEVLALGMPQPLLATRDHKFYAIRTERCGYPSAANIICKPICQKRASCAYRFYERYRPEWIPASELRVGDVLLYPINQIVDDKPVIHLSEHATSGRGSGKGSGASWKLADGMWQRMWHGELASAPDEIPLDDRLLRLCGYYISNGWPADAHSKLAFSFDLSKESCAQDVKKIVEGFGFRASVRRPRGSNEWLVVVSGRPLVEWIVGEFGSGARGKRIPLWLMRLPTEKQREFLTGAWRGDGNVSGSLVRYTTVSPVLAHQMLDLLLRMGIVGNLRWGKASKAYEVFARIGSSDFLDWKIPPIKRNLPRQTWADGTYVYMRVKSVRRVPYRGPVYDLQVDANHSYVANRVIVSNSIHEHAERALNSPIEPILILPDVHVLHFGYLTESIRRDKVRRNLPMLKKDREKNPTREVGIVLLMRDYVNLAQWELEEQGGVPSQNLVRMLREVVRLHREHFTDRQHRYYELSWTLYQRALEFLGRNGIPAIGDQPPVQMSLALGGGVGGLTNPDLKCETAWFADLEEMRAFIAQQVDRLYTVLKTQPEDI